MQEFVHRATSLNEDKVKDNFSLTKTTEGIHAKKKKLNTKESFFKLGKIIMSEAWNEDHKKG